MSQHPIFETALKTLTEFAKIIIHWQKQYGRHDLPWQNTRDTYHIWLSEIMLQQTQVITVIPYYRRFLDYFPTINALANASSDEVMQQWSGLGYYSRARNLHRCAQIIASEYDGTFPTDPTILETLPGIGRSTAAAIAVFSAGKKAAIMDGNVVRILSRIFALTDSVANTAGKKRFWHLAETLLPNSDIEAYTQGLMDLGATICTRSSPLCNQCPFTNHCLAKQRNCIADLPTKKVKKQLPQRNTLMLIIQLNDRILLEKRPAKGIWGGLYTLPEYRIEEGQVATEILPTHLHPFGKILHMEPLSPFIHTFTHFKLHIIPYLIKIDAFPIMLKKNQEWFRQDKALALGLPTPVKKLIESIKPDSYSDGNSR